MWWTIKNTAQSKKHKHFYKLLLTKYKDCASMRT